MVQKFIRCSLIQCVCVFYYVFVVRSQIITKEIEANEWKRKYEESRMEVLEMR